MPLEETGVFAINRVSRVKNPNKSEVYVWNHDSEEVAGVYLRHEITGKDYRLVQIDFKPLRDRTAASLKESVKKWVLNGRAAYEYFKAERE